MNIKNFYISNISSLYNNKKIKKGIFSYKKAYGFDEKNNESLFRRILISLLEEAQLTINLIPINSNNKSILEVGGGVGLVYGYLKNKGLNIISIEPGEKGYDKSYKTGVEILKVLKINTSGWYKYKAEEVQKINKQFDIIISNNVLEHIPKIEQAICSLKDVLTKDGIMIHSCPNYLIPYECHYKIWIIPFFPTLVEILYPELKTESLWKNLNFLTSMRIKNICNNNGLQIEFKKNIIFETFKRFDYNVEFRKRQKQLWLLYLIIKKIGILNIFKYIPGELSTPMVFKAKPKSL